MGRKRLCTTLQTRKESKMSIVCVIRDSKNSDLDFWISKQDAEKMYSYGLIEQLSIYQTWYYATLSRHDTMSVLYKRLEKVLAT